MAEVVQILTNKERLQPLADSIKTLKGSDADITLVGMEDTIENANASIENQANLIAQISDALENKAGSGGVSLDTCTVQITCEGNAYMTNISYTKVSNGETVIGHHWTHDPDFSSAYMEATDVLCGTAISIIVTGHGGHLYEFETSGCEADNMSTDCIMVMPQVSAGEVATVTMTIY